MDKRFFTFLTLAIILIFSCKAVGKEPSVAGSFYPANKKELEESVQNFLSKTENISVNGHLVALISPHAGYVFSGQTAAYGYKQIKGNRIQTVILIGASHRMKFKGASVYTRGSFKTPLGDIKINEKFAEGLLSEQADIRFSPPAYDQEHSLEVQLPFLQSVLHDFTIVPILIGSPTKETIDHLATILSKNLDEKTLLIASTDLSHYLDDQTTRERDKRIISAIEKLSVPEILELLKNDRAEMCGAYPVIITIETAKRYGANLGILFNYSNSGDINKDRSRVVGYASLGIIKSPYTEEERKELLTIAKTAITEYVTKGKVLETEVKNQKFKTDEAVFVTIKKDGSLRGCIGHVQAFMPLYQSVINNAVAACSSDPRFPPLKEEELKDIEVEISILSPLQIVKDVQDIQPGKHGLVIQQQARRGLLLPQVATEFGWDRETFLEQVSAKAGLPKNAWKEADLYTFTADIIK